MSAFESAYVPVRATALGRFGRQWWTTPWATNVGSVGVVGRLVSMHPPWSITRSTTTEPGRIEATISSVTTTGERWPIDIAAPITTSAVFTALST